MSQKDTPKPADLERLGNGSFLPRDGSARAYRPQGLAQILPKVARKVAGKRPTLISDVQGAWPRIVGPELAKITRPATLKAGTLNVEMAMGAGPMVALAQDKILSDLRLYLGRDQVQRLRLTQAAFKGVDQRAAGEHKPVSARSTGLPKAREGSKPNPSLKEALEKLDKNLRNRSEP